MRGFGFLFSLLLAGCADAAEPENVSDAPSAAGRPIERLVPMTWARSDAWLVEPWSGAFVRSTPCGQSENDTAPLVVEIDAATVPHGSLVTGASAFVSPCATSRGMPLPANAPAFDVVLVDEHGIPGAPIVGAQDSSADGPSYATPHEIVGVLYASATVDRSKHRLVLALEPEYGDHAVGGLRVTGVSVLFVPPP